METYTIRVATVADVPAITDLANQYVWDKLSEADRQQGFLTGRFEMPAMKTMMESAPSLVAQHQQEIAGFVINSKLLPEAYPPLVQNMAQKFPDLLYRNLPLTTYKYFFYGPVLVSKFHRGKSLLPLMFHKTKELLRDRFEIGIAFIHEHNQHSLQIHTERLGLEVVGQFSFHLNNYHILVFTVSD
jgi:hypothetical protein